MKYIANVITAVRIAAAVKLLPALRDSLPVFTLWAVCGIAFLAAVEEFVCVVRMKEYDPEVKGVFI